MATPVFPPQTKGVLLITAGHAGADLFLRSIASGQDPAKVDLAEHLFGEAIREAIDDLIQPGLETYDDEKKRQVAKIWRRETLQLLDRFGAVEAQGKIMIDKEHALYMARPDLLSLAHPYRRLDPAASPVLPARDQLLLEPAEDDDPRDRAFDHSHWYTSPSTNPTVLPDDFLLATTPVFLICHPRLAMPSHLRTAGLPASPVRTASASLLWSRRLYDWYRAADPRFAPSSSRRPLVVDAADLAASEPLRAQIAARLGLDPARVGSSWPATSEAKAGPALVEPALDTSTGFEEARAAGGEGFDRWRAEWEEEGARVVQAAVEGDMAHWEHLKAQCLAPYS